MFSWCRKLPDSLRRGDLSWFRIRKIFTGIDVESKTMSCTGFGKCTLDSLVDVRALDITEEDGLVSCIHDREILDVFQILDDDTDFDPAGFSIRKIVPAIRTFVDGVVCFREVGLDNLPSPCPGEIGKVALLLGVLVAVYRIERCKS